MKKVTMLFHKDEDFKEFASEIQEDSILEDAAKLTITDDEIVLEIFDGSKLDG